MNNPTIQDGNIPSGSKAILFYRPSTIATFTLVCEDFAPDKAPITMTGRNNIEGSHAGGIGRTGMTNGSATVQNIFDGGGVVVTVLTGDCFTEDGKNYVVLTAPDPDKNTEDKKQSITFYKFESATNKVGGVVVPFPIA